MKSSFRWWSFLLFSWPERLIKGWHFWEKLDAYHYSQYLLKLAPIGDKDRIFSYNINTVLSRQVIRIKKNIS